MSVLNDRIERLAAQLHDACVCVAQIADAREQPGERLASGDSRVLTARANPCRPVAGIARRDHARARVAQRLIPGTGPVQGREVATITGLVAGALTLPGRVQEVRYARRFVRDMLAGRPCRELAVLLTSEIVTNSIVHSRSGHGGKVTIVLIDFRTVVRVEVIDDGSDHLPQVAAPGTDLADRGRGLRIVDEVALRWGHYRDDHGLTTWFELSDTPDAPPDRTDPAHCGPHPGQGRCQ
jgi:anti-sigma regulatory factor (Ser/Thr protein kinase)